MDENKRAVLKKLQYKIQPCCFLCSHASLTGIWGTCSKHAYMHLKHSEALRELSISQVGHCDGFEESSQKILALGKFAEFF